MMPYRPAYPLLGCFCLTLAPAAARAATLYAQQPVVATLFTDDFSSGLGQWTVGTNTIGNTQFANTPTVVSNGSNTVSRYAQFQLNTYNAHAGQAGVTVAGSQLNTNATFALPTSGSTPTGQGVRFQATSRIEAAGIAGTAGTPVATPAGLIGAAFSYGYVSGTKGYLNEIDFENLTSQQSPATTANPTGKTSHSNAYFGTSNGDATLATSFATSATGSADNSYYAQSPYAPRDTGSTAAAPNIYAWHTYAIDWFPTQIDWYVDGILVRQESSAETSATNPTAYIPSHAMAMYLNFWAPASTFTDACDAAVAPAGTAGTNQSYFYDVANVSVSTIAAVGTPEPTLLTPLLLVGGVLLGRTRRRS